MKKKHVLHVLEHSFPKLSGYTVRSKCIVDNQCRQHIQPVVITSPLHESNSPLQNYDTIDNIRYYRTGAMNKLDMEEPLPLRLLRRFSYSRKYLKAIKWVIKRENIRLVHSHSSYLNGVRANQAAKAIGVPSVYEVRGLWQDTASIGQGINQSHWKYRLISYMDLKAMTGADRVIAISESLREELIHKGVNAEKINVIPNGVDTENFTPRLKSQRLITQYELDDKLILGFIGSIRKIEGLSLVLRSLSNLKADSNKICFLIVGSGDDEISKLKNITTKLGLQDMVIFCGRVPHNEIQNYYSIMDILVYPRIDAKVNHKVTPLKPLEAMAMEKVVIASDVGGLKELVAHQKNGLLFKVENSDDFVDQVTSIAANRDAMIELGKKARQWVMQERDWNKIVPLYDNIYTELIKQETNRC